MATTQDTSESFTARPESCHTSIVAPAYNESGNLDELVREIVDVMESNPWLAPFEVVIVDDGSDDDTADRIAHLAQLYPEVRGFSLSRNFGQSAALAAGLNDSTGDIVVTIDADRQNDPVDIPRLVERLESGHDCVSGWRKDRDDPWHKTIPSAVQTRMARWTGPDIHDFGCTLTAYRRAAIDELDLRGERHRYIPAQLHERGFDVTELEVKHRPREHGDSAYGVGRLVRGFTDLLYHIFAVRYRARPMHFFGAIGLVSLVLGLSLGGWLVFQNYALGVQLLPRLPELVLSVTLSMFGFGLVSLGIITEFLMELRYQDESEYRIGRVME